MAVGQSAGASGTNAARSRQCNCDATALGVPRTEYKCENLTNRKTGVMYECHGQVSYQYRDVYTEYHGYFFENHDEALVSIRFDCYGRTDHIKSTVLLKRADGIYSGWDYAARWVVLTKIGQSRYCSACSGESNQQRLTISPPASQIHGSISGSTRLALTVWRIEH